MPYNVDQLFEGDEDPAIRCDACEYPHTEYCDVTGFLHEKLRSPGYGFRKTKKWIPTTRTAADIEGSKKQFLTSLAREMRVPKSNIKLKKMVPMYLSVTSPNNCTECGGFYRLRTTSAEKYDEHSINENKNIAKTPAMLNSNPYWEMGTEASKKYLFMSQDTRWVISTTLDYGPFLICSEYDGCKTPLQVQSWATNSSKGFKTDFEVSFLAVGSTALKPTEIAAFLEVEIYEKDSSAAMKILRNDLQKALEVPEEIFYGIPGEPAPPIPNYYVNEKVMVRDDTTHDFWRPGIVVGFQHNTVLVRPEGEQVKWYGQYTWKNIAKHQIPADYIRTGGRYLIKESDGSFLPISVIGPSESDPYCYSCLTGSGEIRDPVEKSNLFQIDIKKGDRPEKFLPGEDYLSRDHNGKYFPIRILSQVPNDPTFYKCRVFDGSPEGKIWERTHESNIHSRDGLAAKVATWKSQNADPKANKEEPYNINAEFSKGEIVEVRDRDDETWLVGEVVDLNLKKEISTKNRIDGATTWARTIYAPLVMPDAWKNREGQQPFDFKQIRKIQVPNQIPDVPGSRRAVIVGISYYSDDVVTENSPMAARALATMLSEYGFTGDTRLLCDDNSQNMPTKDRIETALNWLVSGAKTGDALFFAFIGKAVGLMTEPTTPQNCLLPVNYEESGSITEKQLLNAFLSRAEAGVKVTILLDTVGSVSMWDLPSCLTVTGNGSVMCSAGPHQDHKIKCSLTVVSGRPTDYEVPTQPGQLTYAFIDQLRNINEPSIHSMLLSMGNTLDGITNPTVILTDAFEPESGRVLGLMSRQFYLGSLPRWELKENTPIPHKVRIRNCGEETADGDYNLRRTGKILVPTWSNIKDTRYKIVWDSGHWWIIRDFGMAISYLYQSVKNNELCPPVSPTEWTNIEGKSPTPRLELVHSGIAGACDAAPANEQEATLKKDFKRGNLSYYKGTEITAIPGSFEKKVVFWVRMHDGTWFSGVPESYIDFTPKEPLYQVGDYVTVRDSEEEDWLVGKVVRIGKQGKPYVRPESEVHVRWDRQSGYFFKHIGRLEIGGKFEGKDVVGAWFPITITAKNPDGTFSVVVNDNIFPQREWFAVHPQNMRRLRKSVTHPALKREMKAWRSQAGAQMPIPESEIDTEWLPPPAGSFPVGTLVQVKDMITDRWLSGIVKSIDPTGHPLVQPDAWVEKTSSQSGPYRWRFIEMQPPPEQKEDKDESVKDDKPWPSSQVKKLQLNVPNHSILCPHRKVRCVRFTPTKLRDIDAECVSLCCFQLITSTYHDYPNPKISEALEYTGRKPDPEHPAIAASQVSYKYWKCGFPARLVLTLKEPQYLCGYRLFTSKEGPEYDPISWTVEVADAVGSGWIPWDEVTDDDPVDLPPFERLSWTRTYRPKPWNVGSNTCELTRCKLLRDLKGIYSIKGTQEDRLHGHPVYCNSESKSSIYLSAGNCWMVSLSEDPANSNATSGLLRATDASGPPELAADWYMYGVDITLGSDPTPGWVHDPDISVSTLVDVDEI